jgi:NitT/TauT family transport system substrate-binding protein
MSNLTRRNFLAFSALVGGSALLGPALAACTPKPKAIPLTSLTIKGPQSPATVLLARMAADERVKQLVPTVNFGTVKSADELRAAIAAKEVQVAAAPTNVAANLYRKGVPLQLINVTVWGTLFVMTTSDAITSLSDLKGKSVMVPLKGDIPDLVFRYLCAKAGVEVTPTYVSAPTEAMQMLLAGKADAAVLTEPVATAAQIQGKAKGVRVAVNLQQEWGRLTGRAPRFPQVGTIAMTAVIKEHPEVVAAIQTGLIDAVSWARLNPKDAAALGEQTLTDLKAPVIEQSLTRTPLDVVPAAQAKDELAFFFQALKELSPEIIGGDLPDSGFYYGGN